MVAEEEAPLAWLWNLRGLLQDFSDWLPVFEFHAHEHARHKRKMKGHVEFVAIAEVRQQVRWPLVRFRQQHAAGEFLIKPRA